jgi:hypothetical protein
MRNGKVDLLVVVQPGECGRICQNEYNKNAHPTYVKLRRENCGVSLNSRYYREGVGRKGVEVLRARLQWV